MNAAMKAFVSIGILGLEMLLMSQGKQPEWLPLDQEVPKRMQDAVLIGPKAKTDILHLALSLPLRDAAGMQRFVDSVSDPASANYRHFTTPEELGQKYGLGDEQIKKVTDYLKSYGIKITMIAKSHQTILAEATVGQAQVAFHLTVNEYAVPKPGRSDKVVRFSYESPPCLPPSIRSLVRFISGLDSFTQPRRGGAG